MSWLRRLLLLAGLVTGAWLLGGAGQANADVKVGIDRLEVEVGLPVVEIALKVETTQPQTPVPPVSTPDPRVEPAAEPPQPQPAPRQPAAPVVHAEAPQQQQGAPAPPTTTQPEPEPVPVPQPQQAEQPVPGTLPQSGAGSSTSNQAPVGTLPHATRPPATTAQLANDEHHDAPHTVRADKPTFSPD
ncbi:hypothetical protein [Lentzea sp. NBRC 102530]|uniref:hypothetical protein n=1 Tax=Lentzea sp. NBRC 102530 TaxID=3032201 RepID=UPI0024A4718D|nr:hypothetical protein [Lentzea sp. NBRC 102530]GLY48032.1 hypothetical protein Lesp01_16880 [Lentzea sp. NBRC 102530]